GRELDEVDLADVGGAGDAADAGEVIDGVVPILEGEALAGAAAEPDDAADAVLEGDRRLAAGGRAVEAFPTHDRWIDVAVEAPAGGGERDARAADVPGADGADVLEVEVLADDVGEDAVVGQE